MKKDLTEIIFILDMSGSMSGLEKDTIGGFNSLIEKQKKEDGKATVTTVLFDDRYLLLHNNVNINDIKPLTNKEYCPMGCTALLDAIGKTINKVNERVLNTSEKEIPNKTILFIVTDGMENCSKEFNYPTVRNMIENVKKEKNWEVVFLGANIDVETEASKLGMAPSEAMEYKCDSNGLRMCYDKMCFRISNVRKNNSTKRVKRRRK